MQIVAGGGGAYMSRTHNIRYAENGTLPLEGPDAPAVEVPADGHTLWPSRSASVLGYLGRLRDGYLRILAGLSIVGLGSIAWLVLVLDSQYDDVSTFPVQAFGVGRAKPLSWFIAATWLPPALLAAVLAGVVAAALLPGRGMDLHRHSPLARATARWAVVLAALIAVAACASLFHWGFPQSALILLGLIEMGVLASAHFLAPLLQSFPSLMRSWAFRFVLLALVGPVIIVHLDDAVVLLLVIVASLVAALVIRNVFRMWRFKAQTSMNRASLATLGIVPSLIVVAVTSVLTLVIPAHALRWAYGLSDETAQAWGDAVRMNSLAALMLACTGIIAGFLLLPLVTSRRHVPRPAWALALIVGAAGGATGWRWRPDVGIWPGLALAAFSAILTATLGLVLFLAVAGRVTPKPQDLEDALRQRDVRGPATRHASTALAMTIAAIPSVDSLSDATEEDFHKNILTLQTDVAEDGTTVLTFEAYGLDAESGKGATAYALGSKVQPGPGFFQIDKVELTYAPPGTQDG